MITILSSSELKKQKAEFIQNVDACIEKMRGVKSEIGIAIAKLSETTDTVIKSSLLGQMEASDKKLSKSISELETKEANALIGINQDIREREAYENRMRLKLKEDKNNDNIVDMVV